MAYTRAEEVEKTTAVSQKIKQQQETYGTPVAHIARQVGVSRLTVHTWKNGEFRPRSEHLPKLAAVLNCTVEELID